MSSALTFKIRINSSIHSKPLTPNSAFHSQNSLGKKCKIQHAVLDL